MAVVDFRSGGFVGAQPRQVRDYPHPQDPRYDGDHDEWQDEANWDDAHYQGHAEGGMLTQNGTMIGRFGRLTQYVGALISVGLMVMLLVWGYKLVVRDVSGVPVIRAIEGEARSAPDNPGGTLTSHTGLAVNSVAAGAETRPANQVAIAPEATGLGDEDVAMGELGATARIPSRATELPPVNAADRVIPRPDAEAAANAAAAAAALAETLEAPVLSNDGPVGETPSNEAVTDLAGEAAGTDAINAALTEAAAAAVPPPAAVQVSARPAPRPRRATPVATAPRADTATAAAPAARQAEAQPAAAPTQKVAPSAIASGAPMVQIGAFDSNALADGEWKRVSGKLGSVFAGKAQVIQKAETGGRTFWRLRAAGFESREEARRFCAALIAEGIDCIPATAK